MDDLSEGEKREMDNLRKEGYSEEQVQQIHRDAEALALLMLDMYKEKKLKEKEAKLDEKSAGDPGGDGI